MKLCRGRFVLLLLVFFLVALCNIPQIRTLLVFPESFRLSADQEHSLKIGLPITLRISSDQDGIIKINDKLIGMGSTNVSLRSPISIRPVNQGNVKMEFSLFGVIPIRRMRVDVIPELRVIPGGDAIGVLVTSEGIIVTGFEEFPGKDGGLISPSRAAGIAVGDIIVKVNGEKIYDRIQLKLLINKYGRSGAPLDIMVKRGQLLLLKKVIPFYIEGNGLGEYKIGAYVDDSAAGVGTLTFYEPESMRYGALGHMISDPNSNRRVDISDGRLVKAEICGINQGTRGRPGEKLGTFQGQTDIIGTVDKNTDFGIFGSLMVTPVFTKGREAIPVAFTDEVREGAAHILTVLDGNKIEKFSVLIQKVVRQKSPDGKGLVIKVVDSRLLKATGGIIQGMSGSPIIQDGKLIGAVTHVFINDPTRGYGILAEWMLREAGVLGDTDARILNEAG
jgi:stage IV sporulation protein B